MSIKIFGKLSAFGALAVAFLLLAFTFEKAGSVALAGTAQTSAVIVIAIIVVGAILSMKTKLFGLFK